MSKHFFEVYPLLRKSKYELNDSGKFWRPIKIANNNPKLGSVANTAPNAIASGTKSINIANSWEIVPPFFSMYLSKKKKTIAPVKNSIAIGATDNTFMPSGTRTNATAAIIIPPPNAIDVWRTSSFTSPFWKYLSKYFERSPPKKTVTPAKDEYSIIWNKSSIYTPANLIRIGLYPLRLYRRFFQYPDHAFKFTI